MIFSYNICVRKEAGYCCIQYSVCSDTGSWTISQILAAGSLATDTICAADYVTIAGASAACPGATPQVVQPVQKICGGIFSGVDTQTVNAPVCGKYTVRNSDWTLQFRAYKSLTVYNFETIFSIIIAKSVIDWKV